MSPIATRALGTARRWRDGAARGAVFIPTLAFLLLLGSPFLHVRFSSPDASILPTDVPSRQGYDLLVQKFGAAEMEPMALAVRPHPALDLRPGEPRPRSTISPAPWRATRASPASIRITNLDPRITREQY